MTDQQPPAKAELLESLRSSGREALERLRALPSEEFERGRYENGWNGRQILAHIASIEWTYPRLLDLAREAAALTGAEAKPVQPAAADAEVRRTEPAEAQRPEPAEGPGVPTRPMQGGVDSYNERQVAKRAEASVEELLAEFEKNRAATIAAVDQADEALFVRPIRSAGGITGTLSAVLNAVAVLHVRSHVADIVGEGRGGAASAT